MSAFRIIALAALTATSAACTPVVAQTPADAVAPPPTELGSGAAPAASAVPSPADVLGYGLGERFTDHAGVVRYFDALAAASPVVQIRRYGETVEGRPLVRAVIAEEGQLARLDEILARNRELTDPETPEARAREIAADNPAIVYFSYGVHGNESSSGEAAMWTAWDLARGAEGVAGVLGSAVVVIDPAVNPDGRDRYVNWYRQARARPANPNPEAREHWEPWPGGRFNHYLFDLNRDWAWLTQPETRARLAAWEDWRPQVHVDFHEMGWQSSYFFFPATRPINPLYPEHILEWARRFGEANAAAFDARGWLYFTGEGYDLFYPGYGDTWPSLLGAVGMTYEQAGGGRAGLAIARPDGLVLTLRDRAEHHRVSGEATLRAAAEGRTELLLDFARFHRTVDRGLPDILLIPGEQPDRIEALSALLHAQGIRIERARRSFEADARPHDGFRQRRRFPEGTYLVRARQPRGRLAITLLQAETFLDATYSYDVSAWSLPYAYGVEAHSTDRTPDAAWQPFEPGGEAPITTAAEPGLGGVVRPQQEPLGYVVAPGFAAWPGLVRFLHDGGRAIVVAQGFTLEGRRWPAGTVVLPRYGNAGLADRIRTSGLAARASPVRTGLTPRGPDLGTDEAYTLRLPRVAVLAGPGVSPTSYGAHWFFLEQTLALPFDAVPVERLGESRLDHIDVLVLPDLAGATLDGGRIDVIRDWVRRGGTLVAVAGGARAVAGPIAEIEPRGARADEDDQGDEPARALRGRDARELERWEQEIPGTILSVRLDPAHPLAFGAGVDGAPDRMYVLHAGGDAFEPDERFETVAHFPGGLDKVSGVISPENLERLDQASWLATRPVGRGRVILFADDPLFRHFWYAGFQPYVNALIVGPAL